MTTVKQIEAAVDLSERFGRKIATAKEAREIMKIGVWYNSVEETLQNLGMPPNREGGKKGFTVFETDGKKRTDQTAGDSHPFPQASGSGQSRKQQTTIAIKASWFVLREGQEQDRQRGADRTRHAGIVLFGH